MIFHDIVLSVLLYVSFIGGCNCYVGQWYDYRSKTSPLVFRVPPISRHYSTSNDGGESENSGGLNSKRTCFRNFLTQRAVQSFMFLLNEVRDPHSADWIERFVASNNLLEFHGIGALNTTLFPSWDSIFMEMLQTPTEKIIISARRRGGGRGGWSKNNPYLKDRFVEFEITVDPSSLATRMLSVREQITKELRDDLALILESNERILTSYFNKMMNARDDEKEYDRSKAISRDDEMLSQSGKVAFDRESYQLFRNNIALEPLASSPLRTGTFDLALLLSMQESVHRVLFRFRSLGESKVVSFEWLREFYIETVTKYFDGNGSYGRADDFMEKLLLSSPILKSTSDGKVGFVDPVGIAEEIIKTRSEVLRDWQLITKTIAEEHMSVKKVSLLNQMKRSEFDGTSATTFSKESFE